MPATSAPSADSIAPRRRVARSPAYVINAVGLISGGGSGEESLHRVGDDLPVRLVGGDVTAAGERSPGHVPSFVVADATDEYLHAGQDAARSAQQVPCVIAGEGQNPFHHVVV